MDIPYNSLSSFFFHILLIHFLFAFASWANASSSVRYEGLFALVIRRPQREATHSPLYGAVHITHTGSCIFCFCYSFSYFTD